MKPITFPEQTKVLGKPANMTDEECAPLPVCCVEGQVISCWGLTWRERIRVLLGGRLWLCVLSGQTQPPVWIAASTPFLPREETR